jgi:hypothetical protein
VNRNERSNKVPSAARLAAFNRDAAFCFARELGSAVNLQPLVDKFE